ncbi:type I 3-dehydroquinate dehydratase [Nocardioides zeae]|uniref:Uncharacterized protein n=1 Tax=Nocardioides zeae TaxID=1457234 RepID=A0A6P0HMU7_9ACTN|nr:type I 3-dehydroquinate dehydratase [Nocardioides zeae]NEN79547.1 hypothetical protein [Nocardioides zeae]
MNRGEIRREQLVSEVDHVPATGWFAWYEVPLERARLATGAPARSPASPRVIAATRSHDAHRLQELLPSLAGTGVTHVQFEAEASDPRTRRLFAAINDQGISPIPATHLPRTVGAEELRTHAESLAGLGGAIVKVVYPAPTPEDVRAGLDVLAEWPQETVPLSLTPAGSRQGRLVAALAGSALVFVPPVAETDRLPAPWWRALLDPSVEHDRQATS